MAKDNISKPEAARRVNLKTLASYLRLDPSTISYVLNDAPNRSIPETTRERIRAAAARLGYQPSHIARSLRSKRTQMIGILLPELGDGYHARVLNGVADVLMREGYFFFTVHHRHCKDLVRQYPDLLHTRGAEALLAIDTRFEETPPLPTVSVAGHSALRDVIDVVLDHAKAAQLAVGHLYQLGHRNIAFMRGQPFSSDSEDRWRATLQTARQFGLRVRKELTIELQEDSSSPELGYPGVSRLLEQKRSFTAALCFNDISAIGAIRALSDAGMRIPADCSVMGFDDVPAAAFQTPRLSTIQQPLHHMGELAATLLLRKIAGEVLPLQEKIDPILMVRESTGPAPEV